MSRRLWLGPAAALAVLAVGLLLALDGIAQRTLQRRATELLGTPVHIDSVELSLLHGRGTVRGLRVANPPGFSATNAVQLDTVIVEVDLLTAFSSPTIVSAIRIQAPQVFYELDAQGGSNLDVLRRHIEHAPDQPSGPTPAVGATVAAAPSVAAPPPTATVAQAASIATPARPRDPHTKRPRHDGDGGGKGRRYIVSLIAVHDGTVHLDARAAGGPQRSEALPGFDLTGVGADRPGGATPRQILRAVAAAIARDVAISAAATQLEKWLGKDVGGALGDLLKKGGAGAIGHGLDGVLEKLFKR